MTTTLLSLDRTGVVGTTAALLAGMPHALVYIYVVIRLLLPAIMVVLAGLGATPAQRVALTRDYIRTHHRSMRGASSRRNRSGDVG